jgi:hypothetical protein
MVVPVDRSVIRGHNETSTDPAIKFVARVMNARLFPDRFAKVRNAALSIICPAHPESTLQPPRSIVVIALGVEDHLRGAASEDYGLIA